MIINNTHNRWFISDQFFLKLDFFVFYFSQFHTQLVLLYWILLPKRRDFNADCLQVIWSVFEGSGILLSKS